MAEGSLSAEESRPSGSGELKVRVVAYFNPGRFVEQRQKGAERLDRLAEFVEVLNKKLASSRSRNSRDKVVAELDRRLHRDDLVELFEVEVVEREVDGRRRLQARLTLREEEWHRRRRYDGFSVLVGHESLAQPAPDLCRLYRRKDMVEKDFQVIKSVLELHPVRHHTDLKVRAHVTLCMLALLLERSLNDKLGGLYTADEALESLESCRLSLYTGQDCAPVYTITEPDRTQQAILRKLRLAHLENDDLLGQRITPR